MMDQGLHLPYDALQDNADLPYFAILLRLLERLQVDLVVGLSLLACLVVIIFVRQGSDMLGWILSGHELAQIMMVRATQRVAMIPRKILPTLITLVLPYHVPIISCKMVCIGFQSRDVHPEFCLVQLLASNNPDLTRRASLLDRLLRA